MAGARRAAEIAVTVDGPTFLGIGAQKAGTTWLHRMLRLHPDIGMPEQKELHFWDRGSTDTAGIAGYKSLFAPLRGHARGEITPSYAILPPERITLMHRELPGLRLLYVLRNPIERAWSQARMELARHVDRHGQPPDDISAWLEQRLRSEESISRGDYATCLQNWQTYYGRDALRVFIYEEAFASPRCFLQDCAAHLGVDPGYYTGIPDANLADPVYPEQVILKLERVELPKEHQFGKRKLLHDLYAPRIAALSALLGRDLVGPWLHT